MTGAMRGSASSGTDDATSASSNLAIHQNREGAMRPNPPLNRAHQHRPGWLVPQEGIELPTNTLRTALYLYYEATEEVPNEFDGFEPNGFAPPI